MAPVMTAGLVAGIPVSPPAFMSGFANAPNCNPGTTLIPATLGTPCAPIANGDPDPPDGTTAPFGCCCWSAAGASCTGVRAGCLPGALASDEVALPLVTFPLVDCDIAGPAKPSSDADKLNEAEALMAKSGYG